MDAPPTEVPETQPSPHNRSKAKYVCSECGRDVGRDNLKAKRVSYREMGYNAPTIKTRTTAWLCIINQDDGSPSCLEKDPDWDRPPLSAAPGFKGTKLDKS